LLLFCPSSSAWQSEGFVIHLSSQNKARWTIKQTKNYALRYGHILHTGDASPLLGLTPRNRQHALAALANLAKYQGCYDRFLQIRHRYNLKWTSGNTSLQSLQRFFNHDLTLESMLQRIKEMMRVLPTAMSAIIRFACLTGLRPSEACESVRLIKCGLSPQYYNPEQQCLEHFRFPQFIRATKKCYLSYLSLSNYQWIANLGCKTPTWNAIRLTCRRRNIPMDMRLCRKIHGSWLHSHGVTAEEVDFLQGRVSPSVFGRHYLTPPQDLKDRVLLAVDKLSKQIDS
jgi:intergrase/recombinase